MDIQALLSSSVGGISLGLIWAVLAIGVYLTYRILDFPDLTVDGSLTVGGAIAALLISNGCNAIVATIASFVAGSLSGLVTGLLHTKVKIPAILAGILTMTALYSINLRLIGGASLTISRSSALNSILAKLFSVSVISFNNVFSIIVSLVALILVVGSLYWFFGTEFGCSVRATGFNSKMAKAQGINIDNCKIVCLMISNGLAALAGGLFAQHNFNANINMGTGTIVIGLASIIIGEVFIKEKLPFWAKLLLIALGSILYRLIYTFAALMGMRADDLKMISAIIIVIALAIPQIKKAWEFVKNKRSFKGGNDA